MTIIHVTVQKGNFGKAGGLKWTPLDFRQLEKDTEFSAVFDALNALALAWHAELLTKENFVKKAFKSEEQLRAFLTELGELDWRVSDFQTAWMRELGQRADANPQECAEDLLSMLDDE